MSHLVSTYYVPPADKEVTIHTIYKNVGENKTEIVEVGKVRGEVAVSSVTRPYTIRFLLKEIFRLIWKRLRFK